MSDPTVCAIMLTADRPEMARRAVECFRRQTYRPSKMLVYNSGAHLDRSGWPECIGQIWLVRPVPGTTIGELRNRANGDSLAEDADILIHWDDDDWSHPNRISEQVALLQASGAEAVGYREMLFWRESRHATESEIRAAGLHPAPGYEVRDIGLTIPGEAWLYSNRKPAYCLGTSLCYWRQAWEKRPFEPLHDGEDTQWLLGARSEGVTSVPSRPPADWRCATPDSGPRMIASIHGGNTGQWYKPELLRASERQGGEWRRVPEWDQYCREVMTGSASMLR